jgi:hypothetical protein
MLRLSLPAAEEHSLGRVSFACKLTQHVSCVVAATADQPRRLIPAFQALSIYFGPLPMDLPLLLYQFGTQPCG